MQLSIQVGDHLAQADIHSSDPSEVEPLQYSFAMDDSTINIVLVIISILFYEDKPLVAQKIT